MGNNVSHVHPIHFHWIRGHGSKEEGKMDSMKWEIILPTLLALIGAVTGLWSMRSQIKKNLAESENTEANAADRIKKSALDMMDQYRGEMEQLKREVKLLEAKYSKMESALYEILEGARLLHAQVITLNGTPVFSPPSQKDLKESLKVEEEQVTEVKEKTKPRK